MPEVVFERQLLELFVDEDVADCTEEDVRGPLTLCSLVGGGKEDSLGNINNSFSLA